MLLLYDAAATVLQHILPKEGAVLDQHTDFTRNDLYAKLRGGRRPAGEAIIEPLQQVWPEVASRGCNNSRLCAGCKGLMVPRSPIMFSH